MIRLLPLAALAIVAACVGRGERPADHAARASARAMDVAGWTAFRGDARHTGRPGPAREHPGPAHAPRVLWAHDTGDVIESSPTVVGGRLFVGSFAGHLVALDAATGEPRWSHATGGPILSSPAVADGSVYIGSQDGTLRALDLHTGALRWRHATDGPVWSSPAVADGLVVVGSDDGRVHAVRAADGRPAWTHATGGDVFSSPAVADGALYVGSRDGRVRKLALATGELLWSRDLGGAVFASPALGARVVVGASDGLYALHPDDGRVVWKHPLEARVWSSATLVGERAYVGSHDGVVRALTPR